MKKELKRVYNTLTYGPEKRILDYLASKLYKIFTANQLTFVAFLGAWIIFASYLLAGKNLTYLHFANLGIFLHWFGDSLDGRTARLRNENRPLYGHYIDHLMDSISVTIIFSGIALSPISTTSYWIINLVLSLLIAIHIHLKTAVTKVFKLNLRRIGGTEIRILFLILNSLILITRNANVVDIAGLVVIVLLSYIYLSSVLSSLFGENKIQEVEN